MVDVGRSLRGALADSSRSRSLASKLRARRFAVLLERFPKLHAMRVLDLGGTPAFWQASPVRPASVVVLNLDRGGLAAHKPAPDWIETVEGDACDPPEVVRNQHFDLVMSNSVIEHVGGHARRLEFSKVAATLGPHHWIQTPYRYFPVEPHWVFPGMQLLPTGARALVAERWPLSPAHPDGRQAVSDVLWVELLTKAQMRFYFPDSEILVERVAGVVKSLIACG